MGMSDPSLASNCDPLVTNGTLQLNPCGLIANSLFNDIFTVSSPGIEMSETGISWESDRLHKFKQPAGFSYVKVGSTANNCTTTNFASCTCTDAFADSKHEGCKKYTDKSGVQYVFFYPDDDKTQYLYETFPMVISPIEGVTNEHFIVWMRTAALPKFRKMYGIIETELKKDQIVTFDVTANFMVEAFDGTKALVISTASWFGGKNPFLGIAYLVIGGLCIFLGLVFTIKHRFWPRKLGDVTYLDWKEQ